MRKNRIGGIALVMALVLALGTLCGCQSKSGKGKSNYYNENFGFENGATECGGIFEIDGYDDEFVWCGATYESELFGDGVWKTEVCINTFTDGNYLEKNFETIEQLIGGNPVSVSSYTCTVIDNNTARVSASIVEATVTFAERKILGNNKMVIEGIMSGFGNPRSYTFAPVDLLDMEKAEVSTYTKEGKEVKGFKIPWKY